MKSLKLVNSSSTAAGFSIALIAVLTIVAELSPALKAALTNFSGHHWVTKSILVVLVYLAGLAMAYLFSKNISLETVRKNLTILILVTAASTLAIFLFYVGHYLGIY